jgi:hypothetical protein
MIDQGKQPEQKTHAAPRREAKTRVDLWFCLGVPCAPKEWFVHHGELLKGLWAIADRAGGLYTVAADTPVCPNCGDDLHPAAPAEPLS